MSNYVSMFYIYFLFVYNVVEKQLDKEKLNKKFNLNIKMEEIYNLTLTKEKLNGYDIHVLRKLARAYGVKSPSTLKKEKLIQGILNIYYGYEEPQMNENNVGRPPKKKENEIYESSIVATSEELGKEFIPYDVNNYGAPIFALNSPEISFNLNVERDVAGYVDISKQGFAILRVDGFKSSSNDLYINQNMYNQYNLKVGDYIKGTSRKVSIDSYALLVSIVEINGSSNICLKREDFDSFPYNNSDKNEYNINLQNFVGEEEFKINKGGKCFIRSKETNDVFSLGYNLAKQLSTQADNVIFLDINSPLRRTFEDIKNLEVISLPYTSPDSEVFVGTNISLEKSKRLVEKRKNVVLIISQITDIFKSIDYILKKSASGGILPESIIRIKTMLANAKFVDKDTSLTLLFIDNFTTKENYCNLMKSDILRFVDNKIL